MNRNAIRELSIRVKTEANTDSIKVLLHRKSQVHSKRAKLLTFKPITDGQKKIYYLNGQLSGQGETKNKKENGPWTYWHESGQKSREGSFDEGRRTGTHTYWFSNGNLRGLGNFKNDKYDGKWTMYKEDGSETLEQFYKNGELVKQK